MILEPKLFPPRNITITENTYGIIISWQPPEEKADRIIYYSIDYKSDYSKHAEWKRLNSAPIKGKFQYMGK